MGWALPKKHTFRAVPFPFKYEQSCDALGVHPAKALTHGFTPTLS